MKKSNSKTKGKPKKSKYEIAMMELVKILNMPSDAKQHIALAKFSVKQVRSLAKSHIPTDEKAKAIKSLTKNLVDLLSLKVDYWELHGTVTPEKDGDPKSRIPFLEQPSKA